MPEPHHRYSCGPDGQPARFEFIRKTGHVVALDLGAGLADDDLLAAVGQRVTLSVEGAPDPDRVRLLQALEHIQAARALLRPAP